MAAGVSSGRYISEDGDVYNLVDLLGAGATPVEGLTKNIEEYSPHSGRIIGEDGLVYNIIDLIAAKQVEIDTLDSKIMKKLISHTVAEGDDISEITFTQSDAGIALNVLEMEVHIRVPANGIATGTSGAIYGQINGQTTGYDRYDGAGKIAFDAIYFRTSYGDGDTRISRIGSQMCAVSGYQYSDGTNLNYGIRRTLMGFDAAAVSSLRLYLTGLTYFPVGTIFEIWGRTA